MATSLDVRPGTGQPGRGPPPHDVLVRARPFVRAGVERLRAEIGATRNEGLEQRAILDRRREHLDGQRAVEVEQVRARRTVELDRPGDAVEAGRAGERPRPARDTAHADVAERLESDAAVRRELAA